MLKMMHDFLSRHIATGDLSMIDPSGRLSHYGDGSGPPVTVRLGDPGVARALLFNPEMALGDLYVNGRVKLEQGDIYDLLRVLFTNVPSSVATPPARFFSRLYYSLRRLHQKNSESSSRKNVEKHYDLSAGLYDLFLDEDLQYSCAYFDADTVDLSEAQLAKKRHIAAKLAIKPDHRILDIGSGWGGLGLYLAEATGADVTGLTLSREQHAVSNRRAQDAGLDARVRYLLQDYRQMKGRFDRISSVGMFEHVGVRYYDEYFSRVRNLLTEDGVALVHSIGRSEGPSYTNPWIRQHIFPGGYIPALSEVLPSIERQGLFVCDVEILRLHYAETLKAWRARFEARREEAVHLYDERFARMWEFYLASSESAFRFQGLMVFQVQVSRSQHALPLTRNYIYQKESDLKASGF
ncbi:cyclopropane-fatty-acyl-phospholipid synthase family protein [Ancylobacter sp. TS-1]|uniref:SAM-dependent methyltransferase n=1 Tax=Ancylobacter sp. TS-1 TaxID=1850374 RepID=UPI001265D58B|nr:cyclopropane-fatty-acyl-phospholipid synthase family protein [Ancylobacter sp. TS-1]QFR34687.1 methyltransferase domain-containing protein [Ancylobacter sp. TS-1]